MQTRAYLFYHDREIALSDIQAEYDHYADVLAELLRLQTESQNYIEGGVEWQSGGVTITFDDEFVPLIQNLCLRPIPELLHSERTVVRAFSYPGVVVLTPQGEHMEVHDYLAQSVKHSVQTVGIPPTMVVPTQTFVTTMLNIGECFIGIWQQLSDLHPSFIGLKSEVERFTTMRDEARTAIKETYG